MTIAKAISSKFLLLQLSESRIALTRANILGYFKHLEKIFMHLLKDIIFSEQQT